MITADFVIESGTLFWPSGVCCYCALINYWSNLQLHCRYCAHIRNSPGSLWTEFHFQYFFVYFTTLWLWEFFKTTLLIF